MGGGFGFRVDLGVEGRGSVPTACAECYADFWRERVSILYMLL